MGSNISRYKKGTKYKKFALNIFNIRPISRNNGFIENLSENLSRHPRYQGNRITTTGLISAR